MKQELHRTIQPASSYTARFALFPLIFRNKIHLHPQGCHTHVFGSFHRYPAWQHQYLLWSQSESKLKLPIFFHGLLIAVLVNHA